MGSKRAVLYSVSQNNNNLLKFYYAIMLFLLLESGVRANQNEEIACNSLWNWAKIGAIFSTNKSDEYWFKK